jgi:hypothetical protein
MRLNTGCVRTVPFFFLLSLSDSLCGQVQDNFLKAHSGSEDYTVLLAADFSSELSPEDARAGNAERYRRNEQRSSMELRSISARAAEVTAGIRDGLYGA